MQGLFQEGAGVLAGSVVVLMVRGSGESPAVVAAVEEVVVVVVVVDPLQEEEEEAEEVVGVVVEVGAVEAGWTYSHQQTLREVVVARGRMADWNL